MLRGKMEAAAGDFLISLSHHVATQRAKQESLPLHPL